MNLIFIIITHFRKDQFFDSIHINVFSAYPAEMPSIYESEIINHILISPTRDILVLTLRYICHIEKICYYLPMAHDILCIFLDQSFLYLITSYFTSSKGKNDFLIRIHLSHIPIFLSGKQKGSETITTARLRAHQ